MDLFNQEPKPRVFEKHFLKDGEIWFMPNFMSVEKSEEYYELLLQDINWEQEQIKMYGKVFDLPRQTAWYGEKGSTYTYSGVQCNPQPWTKELLEIKKVIDHFVPDHHFNSVLLNQYRGGKDKMGWHADDEKELGINPTIASVSLGANRRFDLKHKSDPTQRLQLELTAGSLLVMSGELQHHWVHQVPIQKRVQKTRINLTYRTIRF
jgi:alkylated DNA repair dioxygenase AlkB